MFLGSGTVLLSHGRCLKCGHLQRTAANVRERSHRIRLETAVIHTCRLHPALSVDTHRGLFFSSSSGRGDVLASQRSCARLHDRSGENERSWKRKWWRRLIVKSRKDLARSGDRRTPAPQQRFTILTQPNIAAVHSPLLTGASCVLRSSPPMASIVRSSGPPRR